jgi:DNA polymerase I-like protein with 3'-5' exonuclease and polymerase domains
MRGMKWDYATAFKIMAGFNGKQIESEKKIRSELGHELNINSGDQLAAKLFDEMGLIPVESKPRHLVQDSKLIKRRWRYLLQSIRCVKK